MTDSDDHEHHGQCVECEAPIRNISERTIVGETPPDPRDREDVGSVRVAHSGCVE